MINFATSVLERVAALANYNRKGEAVGPEKTVIVVGKTGDGKSTLLNVLCGYNNREFVFKPGKSQLSETAVIAGPAFIEGSNIKIYDAPGLGDVSKDAVGNIKNNSEAIFDQITTFLYEQGGIVLFISREIRLVESLRNYMLAVKKATGMSFHNSVVLILTGREKGIDEEDKEYEQRMREELKGFDQFMRESPDFKQGFADYFYYGYNDRESHKRIVQELKERLPYISGMEPRRTLKWSDILALADGRAQTAEQQRQLLNNRVAALQRDIAVDKAMMPRAREALSNLRGRQGYYDFIEEYLEIPYVGRWISMFGHWMNDGDVDKAKEYLQSLEKSIEERSRELRRFELEAKEVDVRGLREEAAKVKSLLQ